MQEVRGPMGERESMLLILVESNIMLVISLQILIGRWINLLFGFAPAQTMSLACVRLDF